MPWAAAAAVVGAVVTADSQRSASHRAEDATKDSNELQRYIYDQNRADNATALRSRNSALGRLQFLLGLGGDPKSQNYGLLNDQFTGEDLQNDPGYQFGLKQGTTAVERSASARGGLYSGATLKALERYGQDYGGTKFNDAFNRHQAQNDSRFNRLASLAGLGQTGASQIAAGGQNYANQVGNNMIGLANFQGAAGINQGNQLSDGFNQLGAWASQNWGQNNAHPEYQANGTGMWWNG